MTVCIYRYIHTTPLYYSMQDSQTYTSGALQWQWWWW